MAKEKKVKAMTPAAEQRALAKAAERAKKEEAFKAKNIAKAKIAADKLLKKAQAKYDAKVAKANALIDKAPPTKLENARNMADEKIREAEKELAAAKEDARILVSDAEVKPYGMTLQQRNSLKGYAFLSPWILGFLTFVAYPIVYAVILSFNQIRLQPTGTEYTFKGFFFYDFALNQNTSFRTALTAQVTMICYMTPIILVFSLIIALLLNGKFAGRAFFRGAFFMPVIIMSGPAISQLLTKYTVDFSEDSPIVFDFLASLPAPLADPAKYVLDNLVLILWFCGVQILIFLAGLQSIGSDLYEAASIDGAGGWEKFWKITLPHLSPLILISGVYTVIDIANYSRGAVNMLINEQIFHQKYLYSYSSAMAWMYFLVVALLLVAVLLIFKFFGRKAKT